jgi:SSS family solute:Na+ symporter
LEKNYKSWCYCRNYFWRIIFIFKSTAEGIGICKFLTGICPLIQTCPWSFVDPILISVPISFVFTIVVSLFTKPLSKEKLDKCYAGF